MDRGCKFCNVKKLYETLEKKVYSKRRITNKEFKKLLNKNLKSHEPYINNDTKILIECLICGDKRKKLPAHLLKGEHKCNICGPKKTAKTKSSRFINVLDQRLKKNDIVRISKFINKRSRLKLKCLNCGEIWTKITGNTGLVGCAKCAQKKLGLKNRLTLTIVKKILFKKSIKLLSKYDGINNPGEFKCLECGHKWKAKRFDGALYVNKGCGRCSKRYNGAYSKKLFKIKPYLKKVRGKTYLFKCLGNKENFYKIGITRQAWRQRIRKIPYKVRIIKYYEGLLPSCTDLEIELKKKYKKYSYRPKIYFGGVAECFKFKVNNIKNIKNEFKIH